MWKKKKDLKDSPKIGVKQAVIALLILLFLIILGKGLSILASLNKPLSPELAISKNYSLNNKTVFNIVFLRPNGDSPQIALLNYNPKNNQAIILHISNQIYTRLPKEYGAWPVGSIYRLGQEETPQKGAALVKISLSKLLGTPVDGIIVQQDKSTESLEKTIESLRKNPLSLLLFSSQISSDLTPSEVYQLIFTLSKVRPDKITSLDLEKSNITESKLLPDSSRVLGVNTVKLDIFVRENMFDSNLIDEGFSIAVFNGTPHPGLAQEAARIITNLGGNVIMTANSDVIQQKSSLIVANSEVGQIEQSITSQRIAELFAPHCLKERCFIVDPKVSSSRAQINLVLGEDYYEYWYRR